MADDPDWSLDVDQPEEAEEPEGLVQLNFVVPYRISQHAMIAEAVRNWLDGVHGVDRDNPPETLFLDYGRGDTPGSMFVEFDAGRFPADEAPEAALYREFDRVFPGLREGVHRDRQPDVEDPDTIVRGL